jgi:hypothetical protein
VHKRPWVNPAADRPSEGGSFDILREQEAATQSEVEEVSGMCVLIRLKVRLEVPPSAGFTHVRLPDFFAALM